MSQRVPIQRRWEKHDILRVLQFSPTLPSKSDFESVFPNNLRADRDIVMAFCRRSDFVTLHKERCFIMPKELTSDKPVMMLYCQKVPMALQYCSLELRNDPEMVKPVVQRNGMALRHAGHTLLENGDMVRMACKSDGRALAFCPPGVTRQVLLNDVEFMMKTLERSPQAVDVIWALAPEYLKKDQEFIVKALQAGLSAKEVPWHFLTPQYLRDHRSFWEELILYLPFLYLHLDQDTLQQREDLARHAMISKLSNATIQTKALFYFPQLVDQDQEVALSVLERGHSQLVTPEMLRTLSPDWLDDANVMKRLILRNGRFIELASVRLRSRPDFVKSVLNQHTVLHVLANIAGRDWLLTNHPDIAATALSLCSHLEDVRPLIPDMTWWRKEFYVPWLQRGGTAVKICVAHNRENPDLALAIAKYNWREFWRVGKKSRRNRAFLMQAIQENGMVIAYAEPSLQRDLDLVATAIVKIGYSRADLRRLHCISLNLKRLQHSLLSKIGIMLFTKAILQDSPTWDERHRIPPNHRCYLPMLNAGKETTDGLIQHVAKYVGVDVGPTQSTVSLEEACQILSNFHQR